MSLFRVDPKHPFMGPHQGEVVSTSGAPPGEATAAVILMHGRGATAESMQMFAGELDVNPGKITFHAPQADRYTWYPYSFMAPLEDNEPGISSGLQAIFDVMNDLREAGMEQEKILLLGFSQGACLALEYAARHPGRFGGVIGLSGGLIGPEIEEQEYEGDMERTPVFLGCSDDDPHIPEERVHKSASVFKQLNAEVTTRIYPGLGHTVNKDEMDRVSSLIQQIIET